MITESKCFDDCDTDQEIAGRRTSSPDSLRVAVLRRRDVSGRQKLSSRARFSRGRSKSPFNGSHRRRDKRNYLIS